MRVHPMLSLSLLSAMVLNPLMVSAKGGPQSPSAAVQQQEQAAMQRAQQEQQQQRAQQEQMQVREQQERAQQEQAVRNQEEQARKNQMQAMRQQQEQAQKMQEQQQKVQQEQARKMQEQQQKVQQEQAQKMQEQQQQVQQEQARKMQEQQQQVQQEQARRMQEQGRNAQKESFPRSESTAQRPQENPVFESRGGQQGGSRPFKARALSVAAVPIQKAVPQPVLEPNANPADQQHSQAVTANLQRHLLAVPGAQAPQNSEPVISNGRNQYFNNYSTIVNNRRIFINPQNTNVSYFQPSQYPAWYQPQPNWGMSNGFTLGNEIHCGLDWLRWGWHPYYGPPPDGFVCSSDYFPTPWIFIPAYGVWRQPGEFDYSPAGPAYDYTGPISVEVLEPRHVHTRDPYSGWVNDRVINVVYFYNAFYYRDADRWGYMNRHGYFIWLNLDSDDS